MSQFFKATQTLSYFNHTYETIAHAFINLSSPQLSKLTISKLSNKLIT